MLWDASVSPYAYYGLYVVQNVVMNYSFFEQQVSFGCESYQSAGICQTQMKQFASQVKGHNATIFMNTYWDMFQSTNVVLMDYSGIYSLFIGVACALGVVLGIVTVYAVKSLQ